jgi:hypothetical protein
MQLRFRSGFSFIDMMMYLSIMALSYHYAIPCYQQLIAKMRAKELIKVAQQAQLQLNEEMIFKGILPDFLDLDALTSESIKEVSWNGDELEIHYHQEYHDDWILTLKPNSDKFGLKWECDFEGQAGIKPYLCYALT